MLRGSRIVTYEYINVGIACRVGDKIFLNKQLKYYPKLRNAIIKHEKNHTDEFTIKDIFLDLNIEELSGVRREYYKFIAQNPSSWIEFLPIKKYGEVLLFNFPLLLVWIFFGGVFLSLALKILYSI